MEKSSEKDKFICIECTTPAPQLYRDFNGGIIRIERCKNCGKIVDQYIEYDGVLIFLDIILHKLQAYRHLMKNSSFQNLWRLVCFLLLCDAYRLWDQGRDQIQNNTNDKEEFIFIYAAMEWRFYTSFLVATLDMLVFYVSVFMVYKLGTYMLTGSLGSVSCRDLGVGLALSSFGKLLVIPASLWAQSHSLVYLALTRLLQFTSNTQALRVMGNLSRTSAMAILLFANLTEAAVHSLLL